MRTLKLFAIVMLAQMCLLGPVSAQVHATAESAKALVQKGLDHIKTVGPEKAFSDFNAQGREWNNGDLYIFVMKFDGTMMAHAASPKLVGKNLLDLKDANGTLFNQKFRDITKSKGSGWVNYYWPNPLTKKIAQKSTFVERIPGYDGFIGSGYYK